MACPSLLQAQPGASDTLRLTVPEAEKIFLEKNLTLLANHYNVDISKALVRQARLWDNPTLLTDQNVYDGKFFRHDKLGTQSYGQVFVQVQQLIRTAGKIRKQTALAQDNAQSAASQFDDVLRNLKYALSTDLNNLSQLQSAATLLQNEMQAAQKLVTGMDQMLKLGDLSVKDNIRLKALLFSLQTDYNENLRQQYDLSKEIATLLQSNDRTWIVADAQGTFAEQTIASLNIHSLQDTALLLRPDLQLARTQYVYQQHNTAYQQALARPDLTVGLEYDKLNSYVPNYYGLTVALPLPLFNRNQGNIEAAQFATRQTAVVAVQMQAQVTREVQASFQKLLNTTHLLNTSNDQLQLGYDTLMQNMTNSYLARQVSLIEFIDLFESYKDTRIKETQLIADQRNAAAELNYVTEKNFIPL